MLYPILFILITAALITAASVFRITSVLTAFNTGLFGFAVMLILGFKYFGLVSACFALCLILRITIKYMDKAVYKECFDQTHCNLQYLYSLIGLPFALLFVTCVAQSEVMDLTYNLPQFKIAFFASLATALAFEINYTSGALLGGTFNPLSNKKIKAHNIGAISIFSVICSLISIFIICFAFKSFGGAMSQTIMIGITAVIGYAIMIFVSAFLTKNDEPESDTVENLTNSEPDLAQVHTDANSLAETTNPNIINDLLIEPAVSGSEAQIDVNILETPPKKKFFDLYQIFIIANACASMLALIIGFITRTK